MALLSYNSSSIFFNYFINRKTDLSRTSFKYICVCLFFFTGAFLNCFFIILLTNGGIWCGLCGEMCCFIFCLSYKVCMTFLNHAFTKLSFTSTMKHYLPMACKVQVEEYCVYLIRCMKNAFHEAGTFRCPPSAENEATTCPTVHITGNNESQK